MHTFLTAVFLALPLAMSLSPSVAFSKSKNISPLLRCEVSYADQTTVIESRLQTSPYEIQTVDIAGRFSFKAAMIGTQNKINHIALYAYFQASPKDLPIHEAIYRGPFKPVALSTPLGPKNYLYAGEVERELSYQCFLMLEKK